MAVVDNWELALVCHPLAQMPLEDGPVRIFLDQQW
jgi:hypothetical protein